MEQNKPVQGRVDQPDLVSQRPVVRGWDHSDWHAEDGLEVRLVEVVDDVGRSEDGESSARRRRNGSGGSRQPGIERVTVGLRLADRHSVGQESDVKTQIKLLSQILNYGQKH